MCNRSKFVNMHHQERALVTRMKKHIKFCCSVNDDEYEEIIWYNELVDFIEKNAQNDQIQASAVILDTNDP
jgi:hypothetical protein